MENACRIVSTWKSMSKGEIELLRLLAIRLERLSVDSIWARRASGLRGNIIKILDENDAGITINSNRLPPLIERAFEVLQHAAQEIPDIEEIRKKYQPRDEVNTGTWDNAGKTDSDRE
jgi:hypothetical protein